MNRPPAHDRLLTVPNVLSGLRLALIPVFIYLLWSPTPTPGRWPF